MRIGLKLLLVLAMTLGILVPLSLVRSVIAERERYRADAVASVEASYAGPQTLAGPVLSVPYTQLVDVTRIGPDGVGRIVRERQSLRWTFFPAQLSVSGELRPTLRSRGIYEVRLFEWVGDVQAVFDAAIPAATTLPDGSDPQRVIGAATLGFAIADVRGLRGAPRLLVNDAVVDLREGLGLRESNGLHARLAVPVAGERLRLRTRLAVTLAGAESFGVVPLGAFNRVSLRSAWPHPDFRGISPSQSRIAAAGFDAHWQVASLATGVQRQFLAGANVQPFGVRDTARVEAHSGASNPAALDALGVVLADPVDTYTQADRATKYGLLFVLLTFIGFFMFEVVRAVPIHPIQYGLVGLALAVFFLLLVSLSEHLRFGWAYACSSVACIGLIGFYLSAVLGGLSRGIGFAGMLGVLYGALYGLLISEDNALVLGSLLLFAMLAAVMVITRRFDWYALGARAVSTRVG